MGVSITSAVDPVALRIVAEARRHFLEHGFRAVTMDDLAAEMGMSKKTLYVHFRNKRELLEAVIESKTGEFARDMDAVGMEKREAFGETLKRLLGCMGRHAGEISPSFIRDLAKEDPALIVRLRDKRREVIGKTFGRILASGQRKKAIRRDIPADLMVEMLIGIADTVATPENVAAKGLTPGELLGHILNVFLDGVRTEGGAG